jgi:polyisoprenoid-binding protein YceI
MAVSRVRGEFQSFSAIIHINEEPKLSRLEAMVEMGSLHTNDAVRDNYLKKELLEVDVFPAARFSSSFPLSSIQPQPDHHLLQGELTIKDVTRPCVLEVVSQQAFGSSKKDLTTARFRAMTKIKRSEFGLNFEPAIELGGIVVSDAVEVTMEVAIFKHIGDAWQGDI